MPPSQYQFQRGQAGEDQIVVPEGALKPRRGARVTSFVSHAADGGLGFPQRQSPFSEGPGCPGAGTEITGSPARLPVALPVSAQQSCASH